MSNTTGTNALLANTPEFKVGETTFKMRRLGIKDVFTLLDIIKEAGSRGVKQAVNLIQDVKASTESIGAIVTLFGALEISDKLLEWVADILQTEKEVVEDPNQFPIDAWMDFALGLVEHPDIEAFVGKYQKAAKDEGFQKKLSLLFGKKASTESKGDTRG